MMKERKVENEGEIRAFGGQSSALGVAAQLQLPSPHLIQ
jgi:hypothetical protein